MKDLYESAFSTIISKYDDKIDAANEAKNAAIDALEQDKDLIQDPGQTLLVPFERS